MDTHVLDKMIKIQEQSYLCGEFLDWFLNWFLNRYVVFERKRKRESAFVDADGAGDYINKEKLLAEFFDIDLEEAERERQSVLNVLSGKETVV